MIKERSFNLTLYTEMLARRAFLHNRDAALSYEDYKQIAAMAVHRARRKFKRSRQVKFETFAITAVRNSLITALRRQRPAGIELSSELAAELEDDFIYRVIQFVGSNVELSHSARKVVYGLHRIWNLPTVSMTSFRKSLRMSKLEFSRACLELQVMFRS